jgi:hypothetical protein
MPTFVSEVTQSLELNYQNPVLADLHSMLVPDIIAGNMLDPYNEDTYSASASSFPYVIEDGELSKYCTRDEYFVLPDSVLTPLINNVDFTLHFRFTDRDTDSNTHAFVLGSYTKDGSGYDWGFYRTSGNWAFYHANGATMGASSPTVPTDRAISLCIKRQGNELYFYQDGVLIIQKTITASNFTNSSSNHICARWGTSTTVQPRIRFHQMLMFDVAKTDADILTLHEDPHGIFRTAQDEVLDYGLTFPASGGAVDIPSFSLSGAYTVKGRFKTPAVFDANSKALIGKTSATDTYIGMTDTGLFRVNHGGTANTGTLQLAVNTEYTFSVIRDGANLITITVEGVGTDSFTRSGIAAVPHIGRANTYNYTGSVYWISMSSNGDNRYYDFNRTSGTIAPELLNGQNGTLVGFPVDSGYVRELSSTDGVTFDGVSTRASIPTFTGDWNAHLKGIFKFRATSAIKLVGNSATYSDDIQLDTTSLVIRNSQVTSTTIPLSKNYLDGVEHTLEIESNYGTNTLTVIIDGFTEHTGNAVWRGTNINRLMAYNDAYPPSAGTISRIYLENVSTGTVRDYDFTKTVGYAVPDLEGGADATLTGFTNVFYRPEASGEIVGYRFNGSGLSGTSPAGITATFPPIEIFNTLEFTVEFENFIRYADTGMRLLGGDSSMWFIADTTEWSIQRGSGNSNSNSYTSTIPSIGEAYNLKFSRNATGLFEVRINDVVVGSFQDATLVSGKHLSKIGEFLYVTAVYKANPFSFSKLHITTPAKTLSFDATTGDIDSFPEVVNGDHVVLTETKTSGWMPILSKQVFTIHPTLGDYINPSALQIGENGKPYIVEGILTTDIDTGTAHSLSTGYTNGLILRGLPTVRGALTTYTKLTSSNASYTLLLNGVSGVASTTFVYDIDVINTGAGKAVDGTSNNALHTLVFEGVAGKSLSDTAFQLDGYQKVTLKESIAYDSAFQGFMGESVIDQERVTAIDCMVINCNTSNNATRGGFRRLTAINCIASGNLQNDYYEATTQNSLSSDATGDIPSVVFTGAFVDG